MWLLQPVSQWLRLVVFRIAVETSLLDLAAAMSMSYPCGLNAEYILIKSTV